MRWCDSMLPVSERCNGALVLQGGAVCCCSEAMQQVAGSSCIGMQLSPGCQPQNDVQKMPMPVTRPATDCLSEMLIHGYRENKMALNFSSRMDSEPASFTSQRMEILEGLVVAKRVHEHAQPFGEFTVDCGSKELILQVRVKGRIFKGYACCRGLPVVALPPISKLQLQSYIQTVQTQGKALMGLFIGFAVLSFFIMVGADVQEGMSPNVIVSNSRKTTKGSVFEQNVVSSLEYLIKQTPPGGIADYQLGNGSDSVWSHAECYSLSEESCSTCLGSARDIMNEEAPLSVGARIWINNTAHSCYLQYEDFKFQVQASPSPPAPPGIDVKPNVPYVNRMNAEQGSTFLKNRDIVLGCLFENTPANGSVNCSYGDAEKVWGHAECFNMSELCKRCLQGASDKIQKAAPLAVGGQIWLNSLGDRCYLRYENFQFVTEDVPASVPPSHSSPGVSSSPTRESSKKKTIVGATLGTAAFLALCSGIFLLYFLKNRRRQELNRFLLGAKLEKSYEGPVVFTLEELKSGTNNFSEEKKLGEGGFGAVYKAMMKDGTQVAVKRLSVQSQQGIQEFVNEIHIITNIQHRNLVRLKGYCIQGDQKLLVYEFLENGSLDRLLFSADPALNLDWQTRFNIAIGVARGLAYLHEESQIVIIHRDIKARNVLLDRNLNAKISDFGISKLFDLEKGFTSTRIAGTFGYLAPEYALQGRLTSKADVYSYGVLLLEIVSGRKCNDSTLPTDEQLLLQWTWSLKQSGRLPEVVDRKLRRDSSESLEAEFLRVIQVALVCTNADEKLRPVMSDVVTMLLGRHEIPQTQAPDYVAQFNPLNGLSTSSLQESTNADQ